MRDPDLVKQTSIPPIKIIVAGGRDFSNYDTVDKELSKLIDFYSLFGSGTILVSGAATGADKLGEYYALINDLRVRRFLPAWDQHSKAAGPIRNKEMAEYADVLLAFWDGSSPGTKSMIKEAHKRGLHTIIVKY